jgi:type VI protein secretion system component VasF
MKEGRIAAPVRIPRGWGNSPRPAANRRTRRIVMLWTIAIVFCVLWLLGLVTSFTLHGFIHVLLVLAVISVLLRIIQGRRVL